MIAHCGFDLHFSMINDVEHLLMCLLAICKSSWEKVYSGPQPIFKLDCLGFDFGVVCILSIFWILTPYQIYDFQIHFPILYVAFSFC